jgi:hypothetical protein
MHNTTLSFCPGAVLERKPQPFVVGSGEVTSPLCTFILLYIANPRVLHSALHTGSDSIKELGLHIYPKSVFQQLDAAPGAVWLAPFRLSTPDMPSNSSA